jgi:hypothetical protein
MLDRGVPLLLGADDAAEGARAAGHGFTGSTT